VNRLLLFKAILCLNLSLVVVGCGKTVTAEEDGVTGTGPLCTKVEDDFDSCNFKVDHLEQFPVVAAGEHIGAPELNVTGVVSPDVSRQVPVPSLVTGRVLEISARLGDPVRKGQLLFKVRSIDIAGAYSDYRKALKNQQLAKIQLDRAKILFDDGAIPKSALEVAQATQDNALVDVETAREHLRLLGSDPDRPSGIVEVYAPVSGVITDQQITNQSGVQALTPPNPFTISDLSRVWIICDVYENNLAQVHVGDYADIHLPAYPNRVLKGRIANIMPIMDPSIRTAKVRLEVGNPGILRLGMFVTANFHGKRQEKHATVPATAILYLHDREWVYIPNGNGAFRRQEVIAGNTLPGNPSNWQEVVSGVKPGDQVIANALVLQQTMDQK
jgi:cobalt-zinc-cadmium efflux system membrane fusion protein